MSVGGRANVRGIVCTPREQERKQTAAKGEYAKIQFQLAAGPELMTEIVIQMVAMGFQRKQGAAPKSQGERDVRSLLDKTKRR